MSIGSDGCSIVVDDEEVKDNLIMGVDGPRTVKNE